MFGRDGLTDCALELPWFFCDDRLTIILIKFLFGIHVKTNLKPNSKKFLAAVGNFKNTKKDWPKYNLICKGQMKS